MEYEQEDYEEDFECAEGCFLCNGDGAVVDCIDDLCSFDECFHVPVRYKPCPYCATPTNERKER